MLSFQGLTLFAEVIYQMHLLVCAVASVNADQCQEAQPASEGQEFDDGFVCYSQTRTKATKKIFHLTHLYSTLFLFVPPREAWRLLRADFLHFLLRLPPRACALSPLKARVSPRRNRSRFDRMLFLHE